MAIDRDGAQIAKLLQPYYIELLRLSGTDASNTLGIDADFQLESEEVQDVLHLLLKKAKGIPATTEEQMRAVFSEAARDGHDNAWIADRIQAIKDMTKARALMIARTESANGYNHGTLLRYSQSGQVSGVEVLDGTNDEICSAANGQTWTLEEAADSPIGHPNCVRAFVPVLT